jgi:hypothetical protein
MPKLEAIARAGEVADVQAPFISDAQPAASPLVLDFTFDRSNAVMVMRDDVRDFTRPAGLELRFAALDFDPVRVALQMLELLHEPHDYLDAKNPKFYVRHLDQVARAAYALMVVTHEVRLPWPEGAASYAAGRVSGVAVLVELATDTPRGGFPYFVENSWQVKGRDSNIRDKLRVDLAQRFGSELERGIAGCFPGAKLPPTLGY